MTIDAVTLSPLQYRMQTAKALFNQAMKQSFTCYQIGTPETVATSPRTLMYSILLERKCGINPEGLGTIPGMTDAVEWISQNSPVRSFFSTLMANFFMVWYDQSNNYEELVNHIGLAIALKAPYDQQVTQVAAIPEEISNRWLEREEIRDQCAVNKWLLMYYLFFLWADLESLMQNDEPYQNILAKRIHTHRTGPIGQPRATDS